MTQSNVTVITIAKSRQTPLVANDAFKTVKLRQLTYDVLIDIKRNNKLNSIDEAVSTLLLIVATHLSEKGS